MRSWNSSTSITRHARCAARRAIGLREQHEQRPVDLIVEVDRTLPFEPRSERRPDAGQPVDVAVVLLLGLLGRHETEADEAQRLDPRRDRVAVALSSGTTRGRR